MNSINPLSKKSISTGLLFLAIAVLIGAFGAHGLKNFVTPEKLITFETGVRYQFYHSFGLVLLGIAHHLFEIKRFNVVFNSFFCGILLFSFNCYFYTLSNLKLFAMIVPTGGLLFVTGWIFFSMSFLKSR